VSPSEVDILLYICLIPCEHENNFVWPVDRFKWLFLGLIHTLSIVIVNDKDIALMNSINVVFPKTCNMLYHFHINKNVKPKCKMLVHP